MKNNILLLFGGNSVEHEISIITALQILNKYKGKYNLIPCYLKDSHFYCSEQLKKLETFKENNFIKHLKQVKFKANQNYYYYGFKKTYFDAVWIVAHGANCEDGALYSFFKTLNIKVIGQSPYSAIVGHDKILTKKLCNKTYVPYFVIDNYSFSYQIKTIINKANELGFPLIIKPANLGSSVGVKQIDDIDALMVEIENLLHLSNTLIIEKKLDNFIELNISAFSYEDELFFSSIEKVSESKILSYDDKYINKSKSMSDSKKELPAQISKELEEIIINNTKEIYQNLRCQYIVRFDYLYDTIENILYLNEVNNIPGSLSLYLFEEKGMDYSEVIDKYINQGLMNIEKDNFLISTYEHNILKEKNFVFSKTHK